ncbi:coiled-coil domain-containing protein 115-like [Heracleum sosnowskyi]|uniref:Vacuolar ATPase assembly protein VMA22 n=1 Tax=Heracleum sosnowskyi TaxID=360622 RepID=A0AAD8HSX9_9APIA|nr:coiled-coil domain-containing protein 115-like [Heracleum sosnowskyi]
MEESKQQNVEIKAESSSSEDQLLPKDESVLDLLDSINNYLILMDSLSSTLREGWLELASARQSMGSSRVSSALFDLKYHRAATLMEVDHNDDDSSVKQPRFTLHKWVSTDNQEFSPEEGKFEEDELFNRKFCNPHNNDEHQEKRPENNGPEVLSSLRSPHTPDNHTKKERAKTLSMFGTLVSPKLRAAQLSFETVLEALQEVANVRSSMLSAYEKVVKEISLE